MVHEMSLPCISPRTGSAPGDNAKSKIPDLSGRRTSLPSIDASPVIAIVPMNVATSPGAPQQANQDALIEACKKKNHASAFSLIESHSSLILSKDADGRLPLHHAAIRNLKVELIDALVIPHRNTIFEKDNFGCTALDYANKYFAAEPVVIALNDKRRKLRDFKIAQENEARAQMERDKNEKSSQEAENFKRECVEEITEMISEIRDTLTGFLESNNESNGPFDMNVIAKLIEQLSRLKEISSDAHSKVESSRLESFFEGKRSILDSMSESMRSWARRVKTKVRSNKVLEAKTDCYSKILVQVTLDDPISNKLSENDDKVDKKQYLSFDASVKELSWRLGRLRLAANLQAYLKRLQDLQDQWQARENPENVIAFNIHMFTEQVAIGINEGQALEKHSNEVIKAVKNELGGILKELRMKGVGGGSEPASVKRRHSFAG